MTPDDVRDKLIPHINANIARTKALMNAYVSGVDDHSLMEDWRDEFYCIICNKSQYELDNEIEEQEFYNMDDGR